MAIIEVSDLRKTYFGDGVETPVLHGLTFSIEQGEFVAIMGPSGSGKSTLLHILGFLDRATTGEYRFEGKASGGYSSREIARVRNQKMGFVFQAFNLLPRTSVFENVRLPLVYSDIPQHKHRTLVEAAIESVGLSHRSHHEPSQLSGGEKQRVAIARALVNKPAVIFADEPTGNLDSQSGSAVMEIIRRLNDEEGHTVILITHETSTAEYARRIMRIFDGRIASDERVGKRQRRDGHISK